MPRRAIIRVRGAAAAADTGAVVVAERGVVQLVVVVAAVRGSDRRRRMVATGSGPISATRRPRPTTQWQLVHTGPRTA